MASVPDRPVIEDELELAGRAYLMGDQLRTLNTTASDDKRYRDRWNKVEDALASQKAGVDISSTAESEGDAGVDLRLNSPTIYQAPVPPVPPVPVPPTPAWAKLLMAVIGAGTILGGLSILSNIFNPQQPTPVTPAPQSQDRLDISVIHGPGVVPAPTE